MAQANSPGGGGTQQIVIREGSSSRSNPLPFYIPFFTKRYPFRIPSIDKWYPFHIPCLELCIPFNCCKCTVFNVGIDRAKQPVFLPWLRAYILGPRERSKETLE